MPVFAIAACVEHPDRRPGLEVKHCITCPVRVGNPVSHVASQCPEVLGEIGSLRDSSIHHVSSGGDGGEDPLGPGAAARVRATVPRLGVVGREDVVVGDVDPRWV